MFELSQIRCFVAVAEELHFSRAAERRNMTQPPLSRQIRLLEHQVGVPLLARSSRSVRLTAAGKSFFPEAVRILRIAEEAVFAMRGMATEPVEMICAFRRDNDNPVLELFRRDILPTIPGK